MAISFPLTLEYVGTGTFGNYPHQVFGEYQYGGTSYVVAEDTSISGLITVYKRDPNTATWSAQDVAGAPRNSYFTGVTLNANTFGVARFGNKLWALFGLRVPGWPIDVLAEMAVWSFDLETDQWADDPIRGGPDMTQAGGYRPLAVPVFRSTGELVVFYNSSRSPERCSAVTLDTSSGTWGTPVSAPVPDATYGHFTVSAAVDGSDNVHCLYVATKTGSINTALHAVFASPGNTFGSAVSACDSGYYSTYYAPRGMSNMVYFTEGGVEKLGYGCLRYNSGDGSYALLYSEGSLSGGSWTWLQETVADPSYAYGYDIYPRNEVGFCVYDGLKHLFWIRQDPMDLTGDPTGEWDMWVDYSTRGPTSWSAAAPATQVLHEVSVAAMKPSIQGVQAYSLEGKFSLIFALQSGAADFNPEIYSYSVTPSAYQAWGYFGRPSSGYGGGFGQGWGFFG